MIALCAVMSPSDARLIVANPVRAGLAETVLDYPYWDACFMDGEGPIEGLD
jgi:hypothetical protein